MLECGLAKVKRFSCFSTDRREWLFPDTVQPAGNLIPLVKRDMHTIRQTGRSSHKGRAILVLSSRTPSQEPKARFKLHCGGDERRADITAWVGGGRRMSEVGGAIMWMCVVGLDHLVRMSRRPTGPRR